MSGLIVILDVLLMICLVAARSVPSRQMMTDIGANSGSINTDSEVAELKSKLANLSIPSYMKDLYINLTYPNGVARPSSNSEDIKVNTVQSYKNQAKSKLNLYWATMMYNKNK